MKKNLLKFIIFNFSLFFVINLTFLNFSVFASAIKKNKNQRAPKKRNIRKNIKKNLSKYKKNISKIKGKRNLKRVNTIVSKITPIIQENKLNLNINKDDYDFKKIYNETYLPLLENEILNLSKELIIIKNRFNSDIKVKEIFNKLDIIDKIADSEFSNNLINEKNIISSSLSTVNSILNKNLKKDVENLEKDEILELTEKIISLLKIEIEKNEDKYKEFIFKLICYIYLKKEYLDLKKVELKNNIYNKVYNSFNHDNFNKKYQKILETMSENKFNDFEKLYENINKKVLDFSINIKNNINDKSFEIFKEKVEKLAINFQSKITDEVKQKIDQEKKNPEDAEKEVMVKYEKDIKVFTDAISKSEEIINKNNEEIKVTKTSLINNDNVQNLKINYIEIEKNNKNLYNFIQNIEAEKSNSLFGKIKNIFVSDNMTKAFNNIVGSLYYLSDIENKNNLMYFFLDGLAVKDNVEEIKYYNNLKINLSNKTSDENNFNIRDSDLIKLYSIVNFEIENCIKNDKKNRNNNTEYKTVYDLDINENKIELEGMLNYVLVKIKDREKELNINLDLLNIEEVKNKIKSFNYRDLLKESATLFNNLVDLNNKKTNGFDITNESIKKEKINIIKSLILIKLSLIGKKNILYLKYKDLLEDLRFEEKNKIKLGDDYYVNFKLFDDFNLRIFKELNLLNLFYIIFDSYLKLSFEIINKDDLAKKEEFNKLLKYSFLSKNISIGSADENEKNIIEKEYKQKINLKNTIINKFFGFNIDKSLIIDINNFKKMIKAILSLSLKKNFYSYSSENINFKIDKLKQFLKEYKYDKEISKDKLNEYKKDLTKDIFNINNDFKIEKYDNKYENQNLYLSNRLLNFYFERVKNKSEFKINEKLIRNEFERIYKEEAILLEELIKKDNLFDSVLKNIIQKINGFVELLENDEKLKDKNNFNIFLNDFIEICLFAKVIKKYYIDNKDLIDKEPIEEIRVISNEIINPYLEILYDNLFDSIRKLFVLNDLVKDKNVEYVQDYKINDIYKNIEKNENEIIKINDKKINKNDYLKELKLAF